MDLRGTQLTGSIIYTLVSAFRFLLCSAGKKKATDTYKNKKALIHTKMCI
jgi:hypothetical protein